MPLDRLQTYGRLSKTEHPRKSPADDPRACRFKGVRRTHHRGCTEPFNPQIIPAYVAQRATAAKTTLTTSTTSTGLPKNPPRASTGVSTI
jgi:hypothetical protein